MDHFHYPQNEELTNCVSDNMDDPIQLKNIPVTYNDINVYLSKFGPSVNTFALREETIKRIEKITERPLICYLSKTVNVPPGTPIGIDDSDITAFRDLITPIEGNAIDIFLVSNGGVAESTERIVKLIRSKFDNVRFIIPGNAYSAATMLCFSGNQILMGSSSTLGPIDPQINGIPAKLIQKSFDNVLGVLEEKGPKALTAYMPLLSKYDLHVLELCKTTRELSEELAKTWLSSYMLQGKKESEINGIVEFFSDYDIHKSHGRSIDLETAKDTGLVIENIEKTEINDLVCSLNNQYVLWFDGTPFYKVFENSKGIHWGRQQGNLKPPQMLVNPMPQSPVTPGNPKQTE